MPLVGISMLSESGSLIASSDKSGEITFDLSSFSALNVRKVVLYHTDYQSIEIAITALPPTIFLNELPHHTLNTVEVSAPHASKSFTLKAYVRSWKLINNKLVRYGDAIIHYQIPFERKKGMRALEDKKYIIGFRNFRMDSLKAKSRVVSISSYDGYFANHLPNGDRIASNWSWYTTKKTNDSLYTVYDGDDNVGYALFDGNHLPYEINVGSNFEGDDAIKVALWWKISGKSKNIEKWRGSGGTRRPTYVFSNRKTLVKSKGKAENNTEETVTEIFVDNDICFNYMLPEKYKRVVNIDQSFYGVDFWTEEQKKHPLSDFIQKQLNSINILINSY